MQVRTLDGFIQRGEQEWPLARTQWQRLYLRPAQRSLDTTPPSADERASYAAAGDGITCVAPPLPVALASCARAGWQAIARPKALDTNKAIFR